MRVTGGARFCILPALAGSIPARLQRVGTSGGIETRNPSLGLAALVSGCMTAGKTVALGRAPGVFHTLAPIPL
jgi:hypothetical protein